MKFSLIYGWSTAIALLICLAFSLMGKLHFGHGLGDLAYVFFLLVASTVAVISNLIFTVKGKSVSSRIALIINTVTFLVLLYFIYSFTLGRGPLSYWDGTVFQ